jgi:hypothetical protein
VHNYIQFVEQTLQAYNITRNNMLKKHILSNKHADISKNHVERFHQYCFQWRTLPGEKMCDHAGRLCWELIKGGPPHFYTGGKNLTY